MWNIIKNGVAYIFYNGKLLDTCKPEVVNDTIIALIISLGL